MALSWTTPRSRSCSRRRSKTPLRRQRPQRIRSPSARRELVGQLIKPSGDRVKDDIDRLVAGTHGRPMIRRHFLKRALHASLGVGAGGLTSILVTRHPPAFAQGTTLVILQPRTWAPATD